MRLVAAQFRSRQFAAFTFPTAWTRTQDLIDQRQNKWVPRKKVRTRHGPILRPSFGCTNC